MTTTITATAPTIYQLNSLRAFGMGFKKHMNGSYSASQTFTNEDEAKEYLTERAEKYNDEDPCGSPERLEEMLRSISHGCLSLDAATAYIEEVESGDEEIAGS